MALNPDPTAVMGRRIGAAAIDGVLVFIPTGIAFSTQLESFEYASSDQASDKCTQFNDEHESGVCVNAGSTIYYSDDIGPAPLYLFGFSILMFVILQGITGWTLGKLMLGIRTVQADGKVVGIGRAAVRWLLWIVDSLPFAWLVALITSFTTTGHRRVGDMAAKTFVVRADAAGHPIELPGLTTAPGMPGAPATFGATTWNPNPTGMPAPTAKPGPQWDEARGTYIQWDPDASDWMAWDEAAKRWDPIPAQPAIPEPPAPAAPQAPPPPPPPA